MPLALHGGSGSGDENIRKAVEAGINKVNIATEIFNACRDYAKNRLDEKPDLDYMSLMMEVEQECKKTVKHFISLTGSEGKAAGFKKSMHSATESARLILGLANRDMRCNTKPNPHASSGTGLGCIRPAL